MKKLIKGLIIFATIFTCCTMSLAANVEKTGQDIWTIEDLKSMLPEDERVIIKEINNYVRATKSINWSIPAGTIMKAKEEFSLEAGESVTINCSYSPSSADVDFGLVAPDNQFYYISGDNGSINCTIEVNDRGSYYLAVSNNSSNKVSVSGFVSY